MSLPAIKLKIGIFSTKEVNGKNIINAFQEALKVHSLGQHPEKSIHMYLFPVRRKNRKS